MTTSDTIGATVGHNARNVTIGKDIMMVGSGDISDVPDSSKLNEIFRLVYEIRERVSVQRVWLIALTIAVGLVAVVGLVAILGG
jgi:hypothetical protein